MEPQPFGISEAPRCGLRAEHLGQPFGIGERRPRLSWLLPPAPPGSRRTGCGSADVTAATATGRLTAGGSTARTACSSRGRSRRSGRPQRVTVRVAVRTDLGESPWSEPLQRGDRAAGCGRLGRRRLDRAGSKTTVAAGRAAARLRAARVRDGAAGRSVVAPGCTPPRTASTRCSSADVRVGDLELTPGFTQYDAAAAGAGVRRDRPAQRRARREIAALLSDGWWRGQVGVAAGRRPVGRPRPRSWRSCASSTRTGPRTVIGTGRVLAEPAVARARRRPDRGAARPTCGSPARCATAAGGRRGWPTIGFDRLVWSPAPPVRRVEEIRAGLGHQARRGPAGRRPRAEHQRLGAAVRPRPRPGRRTEITLTHGEWLDADGDVTIEHLRPALPFLPHPLPAGQVDTVVSDGRAAATLRAAAHHPRLPVRARRRVIPATSPPTTSPASWCTPTCAAPAGSRAATTG